MDYRLLYINNIPIIARLADTAATREQGLMGVTHLDPNEGCLFVFESPQVTNFWMRNCKINLQAVTIAHTGRIVDIHDMDYSKPYYVHKSSEPVTYVLEMSERFFTDHNIKVGDLVQIEY